MASASQLSGGRHVLFLEYLKCKMKYVKNNKIGTFQKAANILISQAKLTYEHEPELVVDK